MMSRRFVGCLCATVVACTTVAAQAQSVVVIGDFEGPNGTNADGWIGVNGATVSNNSAFGATTGSSAAIVGAPQNGSGAGNNFIWAFEKQDGALVPIVNTHRLLKADVTWVTNQWSDATPPDAGDNWSQVSLVAVNHDVAGWQQIGLSADTGNPGSPGGWDLGAFGGSATHTRTVTWDLSTLNINPASPWMNLTIAFNWGAGFDANTDPANQTFRGRFWVDNIRLEQIPEPGTMALCAIGGCALAMIRRRYGRS